MATQGQGGEAQPKKKRYLRTIFLPNSSPVPNWFFDIVLCDDKIPHAVRSVFLFLLRRTVGWSNNAEELSLSEIQQGAAVTRPTAIHCLAVVCDCWGLFFKTRGRKGQHCSVYEIGALSEQGFLERYELTLGIYGTPFPKVHQLRALKPTPELFEAQKRKNAAECGSKSVLPLQVKPVDL